MLDRERRYLRQFTGALEAGNLRQDETPDLFHEEEKARRRRSHLILIIGRKARQLKIDIIQNLNGLGELQLEAIRLDLSKQLAARRAVETEEAAA
jgi:hypothetical protein